VRKSYIAHPKHLVLRSSKLIEEIDAALNKDLPSLRKDIRKWMITAEKSKLLSGDERKKFLQELSEVLKLSSTAKMMLTLPLLPGFVQFRKELSARARFIELYRFLMDDFLVEYARKLKPSHFVIKAENFSRKRKGKRQYLNKKMTNEFIKRLNVYFESKVEIPRITIGKRQEIETLINEEALLLAKYLRDERKSWVPRIAIL